MSQYVNNHYIPQQLLSVFAIQDGAKNIFRYEKEFGTILKRPIALLAQQDNFYDINWEDAYLKADEDGKRELNLLIQSYLHKDYAQISQQEKAVFTKAVEKQYFGSFENHYGPQIAVYRQKLEERLDKLKEGVPFVDSETKAALAEYIAVASIRSLWFREIILPLFIADNRRKHHLEPKTPDKDYLQFLHVCFIIDQNYLRQWENSLLAKKWLLLVNETPTPFVLTDNPLSTTGLNLIKYQGMTLMIGDSETLSFFPLSPKFLIIFCDKGQSFSSLGSSKDNNAIFLPETLVKNQNEILFDQKVHMAFSSSLEELRRLATVGIHALKMFPNN